MATGNLYTAVIEWLRVKDETINEKEIERKTAEFLKEIDFEKRKAEFDKRLEAILNDIKA